jgi:heterodisulfide reductase subunit B
MTERVGYFPGCAVEGIASEYSASLRAVASAIGVELVEPEGWSCCGATSVRAVGGAAARELARHNLDAAARGPGPLVVPCSGCYQNLARWARPGEDPRVVHALEFFAGDEIVELVLAGIGDRDPLPARYKVVCYYGCLASRPAPLASNDPDRPVCMDRLMERMGLEVRDWSSRTTCCGSAAGIWDPEGTIDLVASILSDAHEAGAEYIITACPMCQLNLDTRQYEASARLELEVHFPVLYFTEVLAYALDLPVMEKVKRRHLMSDEDVVRRYEPAAEEASARSSPTSRAT